MAEKPPPALSEFDKWNSLGLLNESGVPRLAYARRYFLEEKNSFDDLEDFYSYWASIPEFLVLKGKRWDLKNQTFEHKFVALKCSKRGNDVYNFRLKNRLEAFKGVEDIEFFKYSDLKPKTRAVFVTLTYDPKLCSIEEAWDNVGKEYNRWISNLRRKFGKFEVVRSWESYENVYPHVHALLLFKNAEFNVFVDQGGKFRIKDKAKFEAWHSFVDVQAVRTYEGCLSYVLKEIFKIHTSQDTEVKKYRLTMSMMWIFRKRAFAVSRGFIDLIRMMRNSNKNRVERRGQYDLEGLKIDEGWTWELINKRPLPSVYTAKALDLKPDVWFAVLPNKKGRELQEASVAGGVTRAVVGWKG